MDTELKKGVRLQGPVTVLVAAGAANAVPIFQQSAYANQIGTKTFRIKRIKGLNAAGANTLLHIGTGVGGAFVDAIPPLLTMNGLNFDFVEDDLPEVEWSADMTAYPVVLGVTCQVEVEEVS